MTGQTPRETEWTNSEKSGGAEPSLMSHKTCRTSYKHLTTCKLNFRQGGEPVRAWEREVRSTTRIHMRASPLGFAVEIWGRLLSLWTRETKSGRASMSNDMSNSKQQQEQTSQLKERLML